MILFFTGVFVLLDYDPILGIIILYHSLKS